MSITSTLFITICIVLRFEETNIHPINNPILVQTDGFSEWKKGMPTGTVLKSRIGLQSTFPLGNLMNVFWR